MQIAEFIHRARAGRVRITLVEGQVFSGRFRTDILSPSAVSAYFFGDVRDLSLSISDVVRIDALGHESIAS